MKWIKNLLNLQLNGPMFAALLFVLVFLPFGWFAYAPVFRLNALIEQVPRGDYLASLRGRPLNGCLTLRETQPDVVVLGDSHAYAGFDFLELENAIAPKRIGHCAIGAAFLETFDQWLSYFEQSPKRPDEIIFATSLRMFADSNRKKNRAKVVHKFLFDQDFKARTTAKWLSLEPPLGDTKVAFENRIAFHSPKLMALSERGLEAAMQRSSAPYFRQWLTVRNRQVMLRHRQTIDGYCNRISKLGINLKVVHLPISPRGWRAYTSTQKQGYDVLLNHFKQCASMVVDSSISAPFALNRDFVNRLMMPNYAYGFWRENQSNFGSDPRKIFDLDHMNAVGARRFTRWFTDQAY